MKPYITPVCLAGPDLTNMVVKTGENRRSLDPASNLDLKSRNPKKDQTRSGSYYNLDVTIRNISDAKAELSALIEQVQKGEEVILAKAGKPVARLVAYRGPASPRTPGSMAGKIWIAPDFDTLPDDIAESFGMREPKS